MYPARPTAYNFPAPFSAVRYPLSRKPGARGRVAASGERNEHRRVASPRWRRRARPSGPQLTGWTTTGLLSQALPSRGESISFLSPARAAEAPTFCDATESRQRSQPRGFPPPWLTPNVFWPAIGEKFGPSPTPLRPLCGLGDKAGDLKVAIVPTRNSAEISLRQPTPPPRRKAGAARHSKTGFCSAKTAGVGRKTTPPDDH